MMKRVALTINLDLQGPLDELARQRGTTKTSVINTALREHLEKYNLLDLMPVPVVEPVKAGPDKQITESDQSLVG